LIGTHLRLNALHPEKLFVDYDDFNPDTMLNRIVKAACKCLLRIAGLPGTQELLRECMIDLADVEEIQVATTPSLAATKLVGAVRVEIEIHFHKS